MNKGTSMADATSDALCPLSTLPLGEVEWHSRDLIIKIVWTFRSYWEECRRFEGFSGCRGDIRNADAAEIVEKIAATRTSFIAFEVSTMFLPNWNVDYAI